MNGLATAELLKPKAAMGDVIFGFEFGAHKPEIASADCPTGIPARRHRTRRTSIVEQPPAASTALPATQRRGETMWR
jgi:hypothetical protein